MEFALVARSGELWLEVVQKSTFFCLDLWCASWSEKTAAAPQNRDDIARQQGRVWKTSQNGDSWYVRSWSLSFATPVVLHCVPIQNTTNVERREKRPMPSCRKELQLKANDNEFRWTRDFTSWVLAIKKMPYQNWHQTTVKKKRQNQSLQHVVWNNSYISQLLFHTTFIAVLPLPSPSSHY